MMNLPPIKGKEWVNPSSKTDANANTEEGLDEENYEPESIPNEYLYITDEDIDELKQEIRDGKRIFGSPAASLTWGIDGNSLLPSLQAGIEGEKKTAGILKEMSESTPGMFVFHSLAWPESNGDTDHIVVYKNMAVIIDSKRWKATRKYSVTPHGAIKRGTVEFGAGKVKINAAKHVWRKKLGVPMNAMVCIAQEKVFVTKDKNWYAAPFRLTTSENLREELETLFQQHTQRNPDSTTSGKLLLSLSKLLVRPRDRRAEFIKVGAEKRNFKPKKP